MTIIPNSFSLACRLLLSKYTISTLQSIDSADNQHGYGCIWKFSRFYTVRTKAQITPCNMSTLPIKVSSDSSSWAGDCKISKIFWNRGYEVLRIYRQERKTILVLRCITLTFWFRIDGRPYRHTSSGDRLHAPGCGRIYLN